MEVDSAHLKRVFQNIQNLLSEDQSSQLSSVRQLGAIVETLGPERTKKELFPYLKEILESGIETLIELCNSLINLPIDYSNR